MFFSVKYPEIMERVEKELKKQVEDICLDFEAIKKDVDAGISFEIEYYGNEDLERLLDLISQR